MRKKKPRALRAKPALTIVPLIVSDQTAYAAIGLDDRQFRDLIKSREIPHRVEGRRMLVLARDLERFVAKKVGDLPDAAPEVCSKLDDVDEVLASVGKRRAR